jgi:hypothetical protein
MDKRESEKKRKLDRDVEEEDEIDVKIHKKQKEAPTPMEWTDTKEDIVSQLEVMTVRLKEVRESIERRSSFKSREMEKSVQKVLNDINDLEVDTQDFYILLKYKSEEESVKLYEALLQRKKEINTQLQKIYSTEPNQNSKEKKVRFTEKENNNQCIIC